MNLSPQRRSAYADRLAAHADFALGDDAVFGRAGGWRAFFQDRAGPTFDGRIILEIGCSDGASLAAMAAKHPTTGFVGLDWKHKDLFAAAERVAGLGLRNVALLRGRGQDIARMFGDGELDEILIFHPDPFATPAELPNRLVAEPFLIDAHHILRDATSTLTLKTDHPGYYGWVLALLGLPEPKHFAAARARAIESPATAGRLLGEPRVRASDLMPPSVLPNRSQKVIERFDVTLFTADFWNDPAVLARSTSRVFADQTTFFEQRFLKKKQPIYFMELRRR